MNIAFIGAGFVADYYATTLRNHPHLVLKAVWDRDTARLAKYCAHWKFKAARSYEEILNDRSIELVINLTNPSSHYEVSRAALEAGKHVYSEKPLAMQVSDAKALAALAEKKGLQLSGAPCTHLGEAAQTIIKTVREGKVGTPRLAYAELDDGPIHMLGMQSWSSESGAPWPWRDELEVGCTLEHAGYYATTLVSMFGPVKRVTACNTLLVPDKGVPTPPQPDLSIGVLEHESGVTSRITCTIYASHDHSLRVFGDGGVLVAGECWDYGAGVGIYPRRGMGLRVEKRLASAHRAGIGLVPVKLVRKPKFEWKTRGSNRMDFMRGPAELVEAVAQKRPSRISAQFSLHLNEIVLALDGRKPGGLTTELTTRCEVPSPMPWAT
ncbi:MAG: Gfo/Idh/MocA family oxidoreductase [Myxococcaceae bacterium]|nr:Gfo/Idh/MocA family oxidoreductase [Myxococcaceae bacterium]